MEKLLYLLIFLAGIGAVGGIGYLIFRTLERRWSGAGILAGAALVAVYLGWAVFELRWLVLSLIVFLSPLAIVAIICNRIDKRYPDHRRPLVAVMVVAYIGWTVALAETGWFRQNATAYYDDDLDEPYCPGPPFTNAC